MATKTASYVEFDVSELPVGHDKQRITEVYGFKRQEMEPRELKPLSFKGRVMEIEGYEKPFGDLFKKGSLALDEEVALFNVYLLSRMGLVKLTEPQKNT